MKFGVCHFLEVLKVTFSVECQHQCDAEYIHGALQLYTPPPQPTEGIHSYYEEHHYGHT